MIYLFSLDPVSQVENSTYLWVGGVLPHTHKGIHIFFGNHFRKGVIILVTLMMGGVLLPPAASSRYIELHVTCTLRFYLKWNFVGHGYKW